VIRVSQSGFQSMSEPEESEWSQRSQSGLSPEWRVSLSEPGWFLFYWYFILFRVESSESGGDRGPDIQKGIKVESE
jgi:hypothetical protein